MRATSGASGRKGTDANVVKEVGKRIRQLRITGAGPRTTQEAIAKKAEISVSFLSMIERGERAPHLETLGKLAAALQVPLTEFFRFDADPDRIDPLFRPLIEQCRKQTMTKKDVDCLIAVSKAVFG